MVDFFLPSFDLALLSLDLACTERTADIVRVQWIVQSIVTVSLYDIPSLLFLCDPV